LLLSIERLQASHIVMGQTDVRLSSQPLFAWKLWYELLERCAQWLGAEWDSCGTLESPTKAAHNKWTRTEESTPIEVEGRDSSRGAKDLTEKLLDAHVKGHIPNDQR
jgi:hypothetical protein